MTRRTVSDLVALGFGAVVVVRADWYGMGAAVFVLGMVGLVALGRWGR